MSSQSEAASVDAVFFKGNDEPSVTSAPLVFFITFLVSTFFVTAFLAA